jgi:CRP/FNR family transcriptional regulator, nitrogen oxide reductase regulator
MTISSSEVASLLRQLQPRFLDGLTQPELQSVLAAATLRRFQVNSIIYNQDHPAESFFLLLKGGARTFYITPDGAKVLITWVLPGEILGGAAVLQRHVRYLVSTEAIRNSCLLLWDRATIRALSQKHPRLMENMLHIAWDYLNTALAIHLSLTCHTAQQRLSQVLANLSSGIGREVPGGVEVHVSNEDLANAANVTSFTASRLLSEWQRKGLLTKSRGKVVLRDAGRLLLHEV